MIHVQTYTDDDNSWVTGFNGTWEEARAYFIGLKVATECEFTGRETISTVLNIELLP